jgi:hypothetical protein
VLGIASAFLGALAGCRAALDATAQLTGTGTDPEGVVHAFLVARKNEQNTRRFWKEPAGSLEVGPDPIAGRPLSWRALPRANPSDAWRSFDQSWRRFVVTSRLPDGRLDERTWDFCLDGVLRSEPVYAFLDIYPASGDTFARCSAVRSSQRYGGMHAGELLHNDETARRVRARGRLLAGREVVATTECGFACGEDGTDHDCDLCVCEHERLATPACAAAKALDI